MHRLEHDELLTGLHSLALRHEDAPYGRQHVAANVDVNVPATSGRVSR